MKQSNIYPSFNTGRILLDFGHWQYVVQWGIAVVASKTEISQLFVAIAVPVPFLTKADSLHSVMAGTDKC